MSAILLAHFSNLTKRVGISIVLLILYAEPSVSQEVNAPASAQVEKPRADGITINGYVDASVFQQVESLFDKNVKVITIASSGGELDANMNLGRFIHHNHLTLFISKYCLASCAQLVFVAAENKTVDDDAVVSFLGSSAALYLAVSSDLDDKVKNLYRESARKERDYYREIGAPESLLYEPLYQVGPICYSVKYKSDNSISDISFTRRFFGWTPYLRYLHSINIVPLGYWPQNRLDFQHAVTSGNKFNKDVSFMQGGPMSPTNLRDMEAKFRSIRRCD